MFYSIDKVKGLSLLTGWSGSFFFFSPFVSAVCVAGYGSSKNQLLELRLPLKLFAEENKVTVKKTKAFIVKRRFQLSLNFCPICWVQGLCAERDFKLLHGGFSDGPVGCLRHIPASRWAQTSVFSDSQFFFLLLKPELFSEMGFWFLEKLALN